MTTTDAAAQPQPHTDRITRWLPIAIGIYSIGLVTLLNAVVLSSGKVKDRAIFLMADGLILFWIVVGGSLTPMLRKRLVPRLVAIPMDWRVRFVLLCTAMALLEEVITTTMTNLAPLLGTTPEEAHIGGDYSATMAWGAVISWNLTWRQQWHEGQVRI